MPHRSAVSASQRSPVRISSIAAERGIERSSRGTPPPPGMKPWRTSGSAKLASGVAMRMSQASASSRPPPRQ
jgi:hypothetical protein